MTTRQTFGIFLTDGHFTPKMVTKKDGILKFHSQNVKILQKKRHKPLKFGLLEIFVQLLEVNCSN
jgi:hypothetical protein